MDHAEIKVRVKVSPSVFEDIWRQIPPSIRYGAEEETDERTLLLQTSAGIDVIFVASPAKE